MPFDGDVKKFDVVVTPEPCAADDDPILKVLVAARELLARPGGWTRGAMYRVTRDMQNGRPVYAYCASGAIMKALGVDERQMSLTDRYYQPNYAAVEMAVTGVIGQELSTWNDRRAGHDGDQDEVVRAFDKAIRQRLIAIAPVQISEPSLVGGVGAAIPVGGISRACRWG